MKKEEEKYKNSVVLLSGGLDSSVVMSIAELNLPEGGKLFPLNISYGQLHKKESDCAVRIAAKLGYDLQWMLIPLSGILDSSLVGKGDIPTKIEDGIPSTWVPQRNSIFLSIAFGYAESVGADKVYIGVNSIDFSGYPDCRPEFITKMELALNLASRRFVEAGEGTTIEAPLQLMTKAEIVDLGTKMNVDFSETWSCYRGGELACGQCPSCLIRLEAFKTAGIKDPLVYESLEKVI